MKRFLIVETASPKRIYHKVEQIREDGIYPEPEIVILCQASSRQAFMGLPGVRICPMAFGEKHRIPKEITGQNFDIVFAFWTGEKIKDGTRAGSPPEIRPAPQQASRLLPDRQGRSGD